MFFLVIVKILNTRDHCVYYSNNLEVFIHLMFCFYYNNIRIYLRIYLQRSIIAFPERNDPFYIHSIYWYISVFQDDGYFKTFCKSYSF